MENNIRDFFNTRAHGWDQNEEATYEIKKHLLDRIKIGQNDKVLDIGCGTGAITPILKEYTLNKVLAIDLSDEMINVAKSKFATLENVEFKNQDLFELPEDNKFDIAVCYNAFPHFLEPKKFADKLNSLLNENGKFAILHSLSRAKLAEHHKYVMNISRNLEDPLTEYKNNFEKYFTLLEAYEDENCYILIGEKK